MKNVLTNQEDKQMKDYIKVKDNLIWYGRYLERYNLKPDDDSYEKYLKWRIENTQLDIDSFLANIKEQDLGLAIINLQIEDVEKQFLALTENFQWNWVDNNTLHIKDGENHIIIEINSWTSVKDVDNVIDEIQIDDYILGYL